MCAKNKIGLFLVLISISIFRLSAQDNKQSYNETFKNASHTCNLSILFGGIKDNTYQYNFAVGASISVYGIYFDMAFMSPAYGSTTSVGTWNDAMAYSYHFGYQIPVVEYFKIAPIFGKAYFSYGTTDGYHYSVDQNGIHNAYVPEEAYEGFDYGVNLQYSFKKDCPFKVDFTYTRLTCFVGLGFILAF